MAYTNEDMEWLLSAVKDRREFAEACWACSNCDIFEKCQEENRDYCEKETEE